MLAALNHPNIAAIDGLETGQVGRDGQDVQAAHEQGIMHRDLKLKVPDATMMAVPVTVACTSFEAGTPVALFPTRIVDGGTVATNRPQHASRAMAGS